jgi:zinc protease
MRPLPNALLALACTATITFLPVTPAAAQTAPALPAGVTAGPSIEGITEYRLANGLHVLLVPDDAKPTTTVNVTYRVGSRHENYGETGMAHLLEHLIFKGTPTTRAPWGEFSRRGLRANGTTSVDRTNYFASFAADDATLEWYLSWQADAMVNSFIAKEDLDSEMTVVRNEMEVGENNPGRILIQQTLASMYQWHNYGKSTIGARSDVENVDIGRLQAFYRLYYQPDNATVIVAGRFDPARTLALIARFFGPIPKATRTLPRHPTLDAPQDGERTLTLRRTGGTPLVFVGYHAPPGPHPDSAAMTLLAMAIADAPAGRLHKRLTERGLAAGTFGSVWGLAEPGPAFFGIQVAPGQDLERARSELLAVLDGVASEPVSAEDLERVRTQWINDWERGFTNPERIGIALSESIAHGDWRLYFAERDQVRAATVADVNRVAAAFLRRDNRTVATYLPTERPERAPAPARVDVAPIAAAVRADAAAATAEAFEATPKNLDARTRTGALPAGLEVALLPKSTRGRVVQARLVLRFGDEKSLAGRETAVAFLAALLDKGGAGLTRQQVADRFDALRAEVGFSGGDQTISANITTVREHLPAVVTLVGSLLREPALPPEVLEEVRKQSLAAIAAQRQEPGALAERTIARHGNPYPRGDVRHERSFEEMEADVRALTVEAVRDVHRRFVSARHGEFSAVGDFDAAAVRAALDNAFGRWNQPAAGPMPYTRVPMPFHAVAAARIELRTPDKQNAVLRMRLPLAIRDTDADYVPLLMANYLLGLSNASRLWTRVRETEGLSYEVRSWLDWGSLDAHTVFAGHAWFAPGNRDRVEAAIRQEVERARREGFTQAELDAAKLAILRERRLARAQDSVIAGALVNNLFLDRTFAFAQASDEGVQKLTLAQVNAALVRWIDPAKFVFVIGGDFKSP